MRIEQETRNFYVGNLRQTEQKTPEEVAENLKNGRVYSGKVQFPQDKIAERRKAAQEKAMSIVKAAFAGEQIVDAGVQEMQASLEKGKDEMVSAKAEMNRIAEEKEKLKGNNFLTSEEYEKELAELNKAEEHFGGIIENSKKYEDRTLQALSDLKIERAKSNPMVTAGKEAAAALEAGGKEVIGMLFEEAKEHMEVELEEKLKTAEEQEAKEKELEERIEEMRAEKKEEDETGTPAAEQLEKSTRRMVKIAETGETIQKELKNVVDRMKLDLEDLKGAAVDQEI